MGMKAVPFFSGINRRDESCTSRLRSSRTTRSSVPLMKCFPDGPSCQRSSLTIDLPSAVSYTPIVIVAA
jgi:hypothetical protein